MKLYFGPYRLFHIRNYDEPVTFSNPGSVKPDEYLYRALQYVDGFEALKGEPYSNVSTGVFSIDELRREQGEEKF